MTKRIFLLLAALAVAATAAAASARRDPVALAGRISGIRVAAVSAASKPLCVIRHKGRKYVLDIASLKGVDTRDIKSIYVLKDDAGRMFDDCGDTSGGVIIVDVRDEAPLPAEARSAGGAEAVKRDSRTEGAADKDGAGPLKLVEGRDGELKAAAVDTVKSSDIESMTIIKNEKARDYDSYGDTSKGVVIIRIKKNAASEK